MRDGRFTAFEGDWDFYSRKRQERAALDSAAESEAKTPLTKPVGVKTPSKWQLERDLEALEVCIGELEAELAEVAGRLEHPEGLSPEALMDLGTRHAEAEAALLAAMAAWEEKAELLSVKV